MVNFSDIDLTDQDAVRTLAEQSISEGHNFDKFSSDFNKAWAKSQRGTVRPEIKDLVRSVFKEVSRGGNITTVYDAIRLGPRAVMLKIMAEIPVVTKRETGTSLEEIFCYRDGFYSRGEETIRTRAKEIYVEVWQQALETIDELIKVLGESEQEIIKGFLRLKNKLKYMLDNGPKGDLIDEVLKQIRLESFRETSEFNPKTHIPFRNGLLRISDWQMIPHTPEFIYLWRVEANLLIERLSTITLNDCPNYKDFLLGSFEPYDIPMLLQYGGYAFYPSFPRQMTIWIVGRPRIGKGTNARVWKGLNPTGYGAISFEKLLISENRFPFQSIEGKNLLVDPEVKRIYKRGDKPDYRNFNKIFGSDSVDLEKKNKQPFEYVSEAKGLFIANLPLPSIDDEPFLARILLVKPKDRVLKKSELIPNLDSVILESERDQISTLFVRYLKVLSEDGWRFISEMSTESTMELWELFSDVVQFYLDEIIDRDNEGEIEVEEMYSSFKNWSKSKGIPLMNRQTFVKIVGYTYRKKRGGTKRDRYYVFTGCMFSDPNDVKVGHHENDQENTNIRDSYYRYRQRPTSEGISGAEKTSQNPIEKYLPKLDTYENGPGDPLMKSSPRNEIVSNLEDDSKSIQDEDSQDAGRDIENRKISDTSKGYASLDVVWKALKDWGITVEEYNRKLYSKNEYKAKLKGKMSDFDVEVKDFINREFKVVFPGSIVAPFVWIHFKVGPRVGDSDT